LVDESLVIKNLFKQLIDAEPVPFPEVRKRPNAPKKRGVYLIIDSSNSVLHVGNTPRGEHGLYQRLNDHLQGRSSFSRKYLCGDGSKLRSDHFFKCLPVEDSRQRALLEAYAIGKLCPKHLGTG
jgi:hypothetical protein